MLTITPDWNASPLPQLAMARHEIGARHVRACAVFTLETPGIAMLEIRS